MKLNKKRVSGNFNPERLAGGMGAISSKSPSKLQELERSVLACMLWEDVAYENGDNVAARISKLVPEVNAKDVSNLAIQARNEQKLRHVPLLLTREMAKYKSHSHLVSDTLYNVIQRPDELSEFMCLYQTPKKQPLSNQVKKGLARAFTKFDEYSLGKYSSKGKEFSLRDVLFLCHAKPVDKKQEKLWKRLVNDELKTPDTWEVALSATEGENKKEAWERLLKENKLGAMALIRNLRNFEDCKVDRDLVKKALKSCNTERVLPFRFITAVKHAPRWQVELEELMLRAIEDKKILKGKTVVIIDVSSSMASRLSGKTEMSRMECGASLAILLRELCEDIVIYATAGSDETRVHKTALVKPHRGFALRDEILNQASKLGGGGIFLKDVMDYTFDAEQKADRVIVITDEQDCAYDALKSPDKALAFGQKNYIINISVEKGGIAFKKFHHINGFSESVIDYIAANERLDNGQEFSQALKVF